LSLRRNSTTAWHLLVSTVESSVNRAATVEEACRTQMTASPRTGQILGMTTATFTACFAGWTIFSIVGISIRPELGLTGTQFGLLLATPVLTASLIRVVLGIWADRYGGRLVLTATLLAAVVATFLLLCARTFPQMLGAGLGVGIAGGSFSAGAYISHGYPAERQEEAAGIIVLASFSHLRFIFGGIEWHPSTS
jgi:MFS transporter, NNP family, nitrate/nitrite transporter